MSGWNYPDRELAEWNGTIKALNGFVGDGSRLTNLPSGTEADPIFMAASGAINSNINLASSAFYVASAALSNNINLASAALYVASAALTSNINLASAAYYTHAADTSDPHGATLTQTGILSSGVASCALVKITADFTASAALYVPGFIYNTTSGGITASNYPIGTFLAVYS